MSDGCSMTGTQAWRPPPPYVNFWKPQPQYCLESIAVQMGGIPVIGGGGGKPHHPSPRYVLRPPSSFLVPSPFEIPRTSLRCPLTNPSWRASKNGLANFARGHPHEVLLFGTLPTPPLALPSKTRALLSKESKLHFYLEPKRQGRAQDVKLVP